MLGVVTEVVGRSQTLRIERPVPSCACERRGPEENLWIVHAGEYSEPLSYNAHCSRDRRGLGTVAELTCHFRQTKAPLFPICQIRRDLPHKQQQSRNLTKRH